jgi:hypothetical protein
MVTGSDFDSKIAGLVTAYLVGTIVAAVEDARAPGRRCSDNLNI